MYIYHNSIMTVLFIFLFVSRANGMDKKTQEFCKFSTECGIRLHCFGVDRERPTAICDRTFATCVCDPIGAYQSCRRSSNCGNGEGCARPPSSQSKICVSCQVISNSSRFFTHVDPTSSHCENIAPSPRPSNQPLPQGELRQTGDLCSKSDLCRRDLACKDIFGFNCRKTSSHCRCKSKNSKELMCKSETDCTRDRETCALNTRTGQLRCMGCTAVAQQIEIFPSLGINRNSDSSNNSVSKCDMVSFKPFQVPVYKNGPNGLFFDRCKADIMCGRGFTCLLPTSSRRERCPSTDVKQLCFCLKKKGRKLKGCKSSTECLTGTRCAKLNVARKAHCLSEAFLSIRKTKDFTFIDDGKNNVEGEKVTGQTCKYDWECTPSRRCTHTDGIYGECAGRRNCVCRPIVFDLCNSSEACNSKKEVCAQIPGSKSVPFCYAKTSVGLNNHPFLRVYKAKEATTSKLNSTGLFFDVCNSTSDCNGQRTCSHVTENGGECDGRPFCICKGVSTRCDGSGTCGQGETCVVVTDAYQPAPICMSAIAFENTGKFTFNIYNSTR